MALRRHQVATTSDFGAVIGLQVGGALGGNESRFGVVMGLNLGQQLGAHTLGW